MDGWRMGGGCEEKREVRLERLEGLAMKLVRIGGNEEQTCVASTTPLSRPSCMELSVSNNTGSSLKHFP